MRRPLFTVKSSVLLSIMFVVLGLGVAMFIPQTVSAGGGVGSGGTGGGTGGGPWGWTTYGNGWALYGSSGPGPSASPQINGGSWTTAKTTCTPFSKYVAVYILGTGVAPGTAGYPSANGNYMGYAYSSKTGASSAWGGGGTVDHSRAIKISASTAWYDYKLLPSYGVSTSGFTWGGDVAWFCAGIYPTNVTPIVTPAAPSIPSGSPATFTLKRTVTRFTSPNKTADYRITYRFNNSGSWLNIPTSVSPVYDKQLSLTISADMSAKAITPDLIFPGWFIPSSATSICVQMEFVGSAPQHVVYTNNPASNCTTIVAPPPPVWSLSATSSVRDNATGSTSSPITVYAGSPDTFNFTHTITNNGPDAATYNWQVQYQVNGGGWGNLSGNGGTASGVGVGGQSHMNTLWSTAGMTSYCQRVYATPQSTSSGSPTYSAPVCINVIPLPGCSALGVTSGTTYIQPGDTGISLKFGFTGASASGLAGKTVAYSVGGVAGSASISNLGGGIYGFNLTGVTAPSTISVVAVTWNPSPNLSPAVNCSGSFSVIGAPTYNVFGASVSAGGEFSSVNSGNCSGGGELAGWFNNSGSNYGSGSQLAALALIKIVGFASNQVIATTPTALTFANDYHPGGTLPTTDYTTDAFSPSLAGDLDYGAPGTTSHCLTEIPKPTVTTAAGSPFAVNTVATADNYYSSSTPFTINDTGSINPGTNVTLFVDGDVYIESNIQYSTAGWGSGNVPSFTLEATGNIYIDSSVTELDGMYIARNLPASTKGQIYTCAYLSGGVPSLVPNNSLTSVCNKQLVVYGSFVADKINLMRTYGTLHDSSGSPASCVNGGAPFVPALPYTKSCSAEVFYFSPETYLTKPLGAPSSTAGYDYIISLPPVL